MKILLAVLALLLPAAAMAADGVSLVSKVFVEHVETASDGSTTTTRAEPGRVQGELRRHRHVEHAQRGQRVLTRALDVDRALDVEQPLDHPPCFGLVTVGGDDQVANLEAIARHQVGL